MKGLPTIFLLLAMASPAAAQVACNASGTQAELNACAREDFEKADAELNAVYRQIVTDLSGEPVALARMKDAQRLWVKLRDADLDARYPVGKGENPYFLYGSMFPMRYLGQKAMLTQARTAYLRSEFLERSEGDL